MSVQMNAFDDPFFDRLRGTLTASADVVDAWSGLIDSCEGSPFGMSMRE